MNAPATQAYPPYRVCLMPEERSRVEELLDAVRLDLAEFRVSTKGLESQMTAMTSEVRGIREKVERQAVLENRIAQLERDMGRMNARFWQLIATAVIAAGTAVVTAAIG